VQQQTGTEGRGRGRARKGKDSKHESKHRGNSATRAVSCKLSLQMAVLQGFSCKHMRLMGTQAGKPVQCMQAAML
jgi:hypothetical protein